MLTARSLLSFFPLFFLPPHIPTDRLPESVVWGGALVRVAEFRQIHLYGKNFKSTPAHQTEPLRTAGAKSLEKRPSPTPTPPGPLTLHMRTPPGRLTLYLPYTYPTQGDPPPTYPIDEKKKVPQFPKRPSPPPTDLPYTWAPPPTTYPIHAREKRFPKPLTLYMPHRPNAAQAPGGLTLHMPPTDLPYT